MRMYDFINSEGSFLTCPLIVADEIQKIFEQSNIPVLTNSSDFGVVMPIFDKFFIEASFAMNLLNSGLRWGETVKTLSDDKGVSETETISKLDKTIQVQLGALVCSVAPEDIPMHRPMGTFLALKIKLIVLAGGSMPESPGADCLVFIDKHGHLVELDEGFFVVAENQNRFSDALCYYGIPLVLKTLELMHKRTIIEKRTPTRQQRRQAKRKGKPSPSDFYYLKVNPAKYIDDEPQSLSDILPSKNSGTKNRVHLVRGHFRFYPDGLFGNPDLAGTYWFSAHEKGKGERINKGYWMKGEND